MLIDYNGRLKRAFELRQNYGVSLDWAKKYVILEAYKESHGDIKVDYEFKTNDGINSSEFGFCLRAWLQAQISKFDSLIPAQRELLIEIGVRIIKKPVTWDEHYALVKANFDHNHGELKLESNFKTLNGIDYDPDGIEPLGWLARQKQRKRLLTEEQKELLRLAGYDVDKSLPTWDDYYKLVKIYYDHFGDLNMEINFTTSNGIDEDPEGLNIYNWIVRQRKNKWKLASEKYDLLNKLGAFDDQWYKTDIIDNWLDMYDLAIGYASFHHNLDVSSGFRTSNGIDEDPNGKPLGRWVSAQKQVYKGNTNGAMTPEKIRLLELCYIKWFTEAAFKAFKKEKIVSYNVEQKKTCITNMVYSLLNTYDEDELPCKKRINEDFVKVLTAKKQS